MAPSHRFRFGVTLEDVTSVELGAHLPEGDVARTWGERARRAEELGYATVLVPDHLGGQLAPVPALMAAAAAARTIRIGSLVFNNDLTHPVVLAKNVATLDVLSQGRMELGLGAGWLRSEYAHAGIPYDPAGVRIDRLAEGLAILKGLFAAGTFSFRGQHYQVEALEGQPKPLQRPHPPVLIGGGGRRVLALAAQEADIVGINVAFHSGRLDRSVGDNVTADATDQKLALIRAAAGPRFRDLELNMVIFAVVISEQRDAAARAVAARFGIAPEQALAGPHFLLGTVDQIVDELQRRRERYGISYVVVHEDALSTFAPIVQRLSNA
jgi:probable F420-dependent oxidoreductase